VSEKSCALIDTGSIVREISSVNFNYCEKCMKRISILFSALTIMVANAESNQPSETLEARTARRVTETPPTLSDRKPNEIKAGKFSYSGAAVEAIKTDNPLELINPAAPIHYGLAEANVVREPASGKISGLKIFSIQF
jgi:hypothetical protein